LVIETNNAMVWNADQPVKLHVASVGPRAVAPISIITAFEKTVREFPDHTALCKISNVLQALYIV